MLCYVMLCYVFYDITYTSIDTLCLPIHIEVMISKVELLL